MRAPGGALVALDHTVATALQQPRHLGGHRRYLDELLERLDVRHRVLLVGHDRGGVLAVDRARRHPTAVRGLAYMETVAAPVTAHGPNAANWIDGLP